MLKQVAITRDRDDQKHHEILDVAEFLAEHGDYGSGANTVVVMIRQSPLYKRTLTKDEFQKWLADRNAAIEPQSSESN